jgi:hypothetical protein
MARRYFHAPLGEEVRAIGGAYTLLKEIVLAVDEHRILAVIGVGTFDTSCCGTGGCAYALVPGIITADRNDGEPSTLVEPIREEALRREVSNMLRTTQHVQDVRFWSPDDTQSTELTRSRDGASAIRPSEFPLAGEETPK